MSADIASYHSGDSDDNSSDPIVVPNTSSKKRKARGQNVLVDLEERRAKSSVPLPLEVDVVSSKIVGKESITFPRLIGREVRLHVPGWYHSWASVPQQHQDLVLSRVKHYYEIDNNEHASTILQITLAEMADKYKKRKSLRHAHFKKFYKKPEDFEQAVDNPPNDVNAEHWRQICQFFTSPEFIARSQQNKNNREKSKYPTTQGSKSLAGMRSENRNVGYIETWKEAHINKKTKTFVNENARRDYERLKAAYEKRASIPNSGPVDEIAILREVLGERRGHNRGVGRKLKGQSSTHRTQPVPTQQMPMDPRVERELARLRRKIQHMSQKLAPEDRLPSDDEIVDMGATHPIGPSQTHMSVDGSSSSSQPMATQYQQSQQTPLPLMFPFMFGQPSSSQQMSPFTWPMTPMSQMQMIQMMMQMQQMWQMMQTQQFPQMMQTQQMQQTLQMMQTPQVQQTLCMPNILHQQIQGNKDDDNDDEEEEEEEENEENEEEDEEEEE